MALSAGAAAGIMLATTLASTAVGVYGSIQQGQQQRALAEAQAKQSAIAGEMAELNSRAQAAEVSNEALRLRSKQVAQGAEAGLTMDSGSFLAVIADSAKKAEDDRLNILRTGRLNRAAAEAQSSMYQSAGQYASQAGYVKAGSTLLSGITQGMKISSDAGWFD